jgi:hypothetical protein
MPDLDQSDPSGNYASFAHSITSLAAEVRQWMRLGPTDRVEMHVTPWGTTLIIHTEAQATFDRAEDEEWDIATVATHELLAENGPEAFDALTYRAGGLLVQVFGPRRSV